MQPSSQPSSLSGAEPPASGAHIALWIRDAREGSASALGRTLEAARKYLLLVANRALDQQLQSKVGASDLVQDTFVEAQRDFDQFQGTTEEELFAWLTAILANRLSNNVRHYRKTRKRTVDRELPQEAVDQALARLHGDSETPSALVLAQDEERRIKLAMEQLSEPLREVLIERTWQRKSFAEIANGRNCTANAARKLWWRAVQQLERVLRDTV